MKHTATIALSALLLASCSHHYPVSADPAAVLSKWNADVPAKELRLEPQGSANILRSPAGIWVSYTPEKRSWMLMAPAPIARSACTELLVATTGITPEQSRHLLEKASNADKWTVREGNLELSFNASGGLLCSIADTSRQ